MTTEIRDWIRSYTDRVDVPPRPPASEIMRRAGVARPDRARRFAPVGAAVAVCLLLVAIIVWPGYGPNDRPPAGDAPGAPATLPDRIAGYSYLTGSVSSSPPGRAVALYQQGFGVELFDFPQALVLGADGDVYRRVDLAESRAGGNSQGDPAPMLLSPDGTHVAVGSISNAGDLAVLDLQTGRTNTLPAKDRGNVIPLAFSPDGRYLAALEIVGDAAPYSGNPMAGPLVLYDVRRGGEPLRFAGYQHAWRVAFSPDGNELAVAAQSSGGQVSVIDRQGRLLRTLDVPAGYFLASNTAWSPDGALLAVAPGTSAESTVAFADATGAGKPVPAPVPTDGWTAPLGWTGPDRLLVRELGTYTDTDNVIVEVNLTTQERRQITWVDTDPSDNFMLGDFQFATGLLADLKLRPASAPDRGPWPIWLRVGGVLVIAALAGVVFLWIRRRQRLRRMPPRPKRQRRRPADAYLSLRPIGDPADRTARDD